MSVEGDDDRKKLKTLGCLLDRIRIEKKGDFGVWSEYFFLSFDPS